MPKSKTLLRKEAENRQAIYEALSKDEKIKRIKSRRGESKKEIRRVNK